MVESQSRTIRNLLGTSAFMTYLLFGFSFGLSAGLAPGPLTALVMQRSLQGGFASGLRVALAPLLTDIPIILLSFLLVGRLPEAYLDGLLIVGGLFVIWLAIDALRKGAKSSDTKKPSSARQDLLHGALINFLNPHPYLFWIAVGAPTLVRAWRSEPVHAVAFILSFYLLLIGSKIGLAALFSRGERLPQTYHHLLIRLSSVLLLVAGLYMIYTACQGLVSPQ